MKWLIQNSKEKSQTSSRAHSRGLFFSGSKILTGTQFDSSNGRHTFTVLVKENWPADSVHVY